MKKVSFMFDCAHMMLENDWSDAISILYDVAPVTDFHMKIGVELPLELLLGVIAKGAAGAPLLIVNLTVST